MAERISALGPGPARTGLIVERIQSSPVPPGRLWHRLGGRRVLVPSLLAVVLGAGALASWRTDPAPAPAARKAASPPSPAATSSSPSGRGPLRAHVSRPPVVRAKQVARPKPKPQPRLRPQLQRPAVQPEPRRVDRVKRKASRRPAAKKTARPRSQPRPPKRRPDHRQQSHQQEDPRHLVDMPGWDRTACLSQYPAAVAPQICGGVLDRIFR